MSFASREHQRDSAGGTLLLRVWDTSLAVVTWAASLAPNSYSTLNLVASLFRCLTWAIWYWVLSETFFPKIHGRKISKKLHCCPPTSSENQWDLGYDHPKTVSEPLPMATPRQSVSPWLCPSQDRWWVLLDYVHPKTAIESLAMPSFPTRTESAHSGEEGDSLREALESSLGILALI